MTALRIGLIGCPQVAQLAVVRPAARSPDAQAYAVASRSVARAEAFAQTHGIGVVHRSFRDVLEDEHVDAVYIGLPNELHASWAAAALEAGKHVLVEKPLCLTADEARTLASHARLAGRGLKEAVTTATHPWLDDARELVDSRAFGALDRVAVAMSFSLDAQRLAARPPLTRGGGAFRDTAPYWLQIVQATCGLAGCAEALELQGAGTGADIHARAQIRLSTGAQATLQASHAGAYEASVRFTFADGEFVLPNIFRANVARCKLTAELLDTRCGERSRRAYGPFNAFERQFADFLRMSRSPEPWRWAAATLDRARMTDALLGVARSGPSLRPVKNDAAPRVRRRWWAHAAEDDGDA